MTKEAKEREPPLLEEMVETLALSNLIFLYADMRMMSQTGRIGTKFETIAVDSDYTVKATARQLAGLPDDDGGISMAKESRNEIDEGLSTAQLMATLLLELHSHVEATRKADSKSKRASSKDVEKHDKFTTFMADSHKKRRAEADSMHSLLKAYADMVGRDLNKTVPHIEARWSVVGITKSLDSIAEEVEKDEHEDEEGKEVPIGLEFGRKAQERIAMIPEDVHDLRQHALSRQRSFVQRAKDKRKSIMLGEEARANQQFGEVTDALFNMGETSKNVMQSVGKRQSLSEKELVDIMRKAVESRIYDKLNFMTNFFRRGTVCELIIKSKAKIVWMNDWFPVKDLTYAIAVDKARKRVLVVFRGAITRADWAHAFEFDQRTVHNPIQEDFEGKPNTISIYRGFYRYLFRIRKDTGTKKFDEIANTAHRYGLDKIGEDYKLVVCGHSLGAALSTVFSFYASTEERFTKNGPIRVFTFGSPSVGGHDFADSFRHQEETKKLQYARFYNHNDFFAYFPSNFKITKRGSSFRHVGIGIKIKPVPLLLKSCRKWKPSVYYVGDEGFWASYCRGIGRNFLFHSPAPWRMPKMHTVAELQKRVMDGLVLEDDSKESEMFEKPLDELYEILVGVKRDVEQQS